MKHSTIAVGLTSAVFCLVSCDSKSDREASGSGEGDKPLIEKPVLMNGQSRFLDEVGKESFDQAEPPAEAPLFRWDFSEKGISHEYTYQQAMRVLMDTGFSMEQKQSVSATGSMLIRSQGDATAELVLKDVTMMVSQGDMDGVEQTMPPVVLQGMMENGSGPFGNQPQDMFLKLLFILPAESMAVGESIELPMNMPYHLNGSALVVKGQSKATLTQYVTIDDRLCAQIDVETEISELNLPPEIVGGYAIAIRGKSVLYFDVQQRCIVNGTIALLMESKSDVPMPGVESPDGEEGEPVRRKSSTVMDSLIKLRLEK